MIKIKKWSVEFLLLLEIRKDEPYREINARVSVYRCKRCYNPHEGAEPLKFLPWAMRNYVLNDYSERSPHFHLTAAEDITMELDQHRILPIFIIKAQDLKRFRR